MEEDDSRRFWLSRYLDCGVEVNGRIFSVTVVADSLRVLVVEGLWQEEILAGAIVAEQTATSSAMMAPVEEREDGFARCALVLRVIGSPDRSSSHGDCGIGK
jgi:hypothetical protein